MSIEKDSDGVLNALCELTPVNELPEWYNNDYMYDDFEDIPINTLSDNEFWMPCYNGINYVKQ